MNKKRLSIGIFIDTFFPMIDGVVVVVDNYATTLSKDHDVTIFTIDAPKGYIHLPKPYTVVRCKTMKLPFSDYRIPAPFIDRTFRKTLSKYKFDVIHIHSPFGIGEIGANHAKKHNIPLISTYHSQYKQDFKSSSKSDIFTSGMMKKIMTVFNKCDFSYAVNRKVKEVYEEYGSLVPIVVRNNGTDLQYYENKEEINKLRETLKIKENEKVFLFIGRIDALKNIFFTMNVLKQLKNNGVSFKMLWVGSGRDLKELEEQAKKLDLETENIFVGRVMDRVEISKYYNLADLFIFPSLYDASSLVQIEAASQRTPSIFIDGAVTADTISKNINGYTAPNDVSLFAAEVERLLKNIEQYEEVSTNAYKEIYVSWDEVVKETLKDYYSLIFERYNSE